ncbi:thioredoxin domain-containing protein [Pseudofrankia sp. BMG5.37]|uniref:DsbA family protein n=1 Tax=Pseudofrankia sp. BMG5.37 TaxID=3050035 RepID=UPI00289429AE|nr:thioredoxin domain-containing protein [Pseudofrankia sp. BMG5.37]MDT3438257.1 thioredoxin domain-containing protein [Pseudofrankia sp. BMG5.37]
MERVSADRSDSSSASRSNGAADFATALRPAVTPETCAVPTGKGTVPGTATSAGPRAPDGGLVLPAAPVRADERPSRGDPDAPVVLVEYGDFQCPYCAQAAPVLHELVESDGTLVRHEFRHFPVFEIHPYALTAALAAEAAHAYGQFWQMHDLLFAHQDRLKDIDLRIRAERLGLDPDLVVGDAAQPYGDAVEADYERGVAEGVRGTPTLFVNGQLFRGRPELPALRRAVRVAATSALVTAPRPVLSPVPALAGPAGALFAADADPAELGDSGDPAGPAAPPAPHRVRWRAPWAARR